MSDCLQCKREIVSVDWLNRGTGLCLKCAELRRQREAAKYPAYYRRWLGRIGCCVKIARDYMGRFYKGE